MTPDTDNSSLELHGTRQHTALGFSETVWGYVISKGGAARKRAAVGELLAVLGCLFFATAAFAQWLVPGSMPMVGATTIKISGSLGFAVVSALLYLIARRGLTVEMQIDTNRQALRIVRRNRRGRSTPVSRIDFALIGSVYIKRSKSEMVADQLFIRRASGGPAIMVASAPADELEPLLFRMQQDFRGQLARPPRRSAHCATQVAPRRARSAFATG